MKRFYFLLLITLPIFLAVTLSLMDKKYLLCPIAYKCDFAVRNDTLGEGLFGARRSGGRRMHQGIDLLAPLGTPVLAARSGVVASAKRTRGMGNFVIIKHPAGACTIYGHLQDIYVVNGQLVRQGQVVGSVGKTGNANHRAVLAHLHFEIRQNNTPQDPLNYLE